MDLLGALSSALRVMTDVDEIRADAITTTFEWGVVDTCRPTDTGRWETGIALTGKHWRIAEQYNSKEEAISGHIKWAEALDANHELECPDVSNTWYEGLEDEGWRDRDEEDEM